MRNSLQGILSFCGSIMYLHWFFCLFSPTDKLLQNWLNYLLFYEGKANLKQFCSKTKISTQKIKTRVLIGSAEYLEYNYMKPYVHST